MIPILLELKNFLSYGGTTVKVDFKNHSLICLSGKNGNGKSALLDAMTWALWGQGRKISGTAKADAGLLRLGQTRMMVCLEFLSSGQRYRVRREYTKTFGKSSATLDLELCKDDMSVDSLSATFVSLTEKTVRQTQEKIEKIIGLDFDTFVNSAFLRQGQANEFSQKTPKERKQILANILGLSRYDELSRLALEQMRKQQQESSVLQKIEENICVELEQEKEVVQKLKEKQATLENVVKELNGMTKEREKKEKERAEIVEKKYQIEQLDRDLKKVTESLGKKREEFFDYASQWRRIHAMFLKAPDVANLEEERKKLFNQEKVFRDQQQKSIALQEKIIATREIYHRESIIVEKDKQKKEQEEYLTLEKTKLAHAQVVTLHKQKKESCEKAEAKKKNILKELEKIERELKNSEAFEKQFEDLKKQFEKRRAFYQKLVQQGNWTKNELIELARKDVVVQDKKNPSCPLCEQMLTVKRKQFLGRIFSRQKVFLEHRLNRITTLLSRLKKLLFEQHTQVQNLTFQNDRLKQLQANKETFDKTLSEAMQELKKESVACDVLMTQVNTEQKKLERLTKEFEKNEQNKQHDNEKTKLIKKELDALEKEKSAVLYDKKRHDEVVTKLEVCQKMLSDLESLKTERAQQAQRKLFIARCGKEARELRRQQNILLLKRKAIIFDSDGEKKLLMLLEELKNNFDKSNKYRELLLQEQASLKTKLDRFVVLKKEQQTRKKSIEKMQEEAREYQVLAKMFGKDGLQALLIEQAIPEIEQEANALLAKLTDNTSQIFIESLRDLKRGGTKESLDIHISDASGIRPYELFSGGEAFRIDFALRIAISKLLARRAGTALQTLIIDEGFGSQDEDGLQRLMDAIYAIQKDFVKIVVVSHLPIFKDNFPIHFVVEKNSLGSHVRVEERG